MYPMENPDIPPKGEDRELDPEFEALAQLLLDIYLWKLKEEKKRQDETKAYAPKQE